VNEPFELLVQAPLRFDQSIGYWTGEPDSEVLARALAAVPAHPDVRRLMTEAGVLLRGPAEPVREEARQLRDAGLE
jgi:hypothetical protein